MFLLLISFISSILQSGYAATQTNIYAYTQAGMFSPNVKNALFRIYVPNSSDGTVSVIDPATYKVIQTFHTGQNPQHIVPSYDLKTLWVLNNKGNSLTPIDPMTAKPGVNITVDDPYNLYFTSDGKFALVVCEERKQLQFRDPHTMKLLSIIPLGCYGANHMEFSLDGHYAIVTCEFSGQLVKVDLVKHQVIGTLSFNTTHAVSTNHVLSNFQITANGNILTASAGSMSQMKSMPQDIRSSSDGQIFFVADMMKDGVILINSNSLKQVGFIPTGIGTHAIYPSRNGKLFYVSNRGCHETKCGPHGPGSISVIDPVKKKVVATWVIPQGGSPDMGNVTADGKELWLAGRYDNEVYVFDTVAGKLSHRISVGDEPHGLAVWPQPGRYSLGHTGNMR
ncbi:MAG: YncE family protein [Gammaproteobacteria bacterium]|nr:YncE family protein [Gammaproteobacteria bacterium]